MHEVYGMHNMEYQFDWNLNARKSLQIPGISQVEMVHFYSYKLLCREELLSSSMLEAVLHGVTE